MTRLTCHYTTINVEKSTVHYTTINVENKKIMFNIRWIPVLCCRCQKFTILQRGCCKRCCFQLVCYVSVRILLAEFVLLIGIRYICDVTTNIVYTINY